MIKTKQLIDRTEKRKPSFQIMIDHVSKKTKPLIIETGCVRSINNFGGDGMSTVIFDTFIEEHGDGEYYSVDINQSNVDIAQKMTKHVKITCCDSVKFLHDMNKKLIKENKSIDLLYLDSFDYHEGIKHQSSLHHIKELISIWPSCFEGTMISIDDNFEDGTGKGHYAKEFFKDIGIDQIFDGYQMIWKI